MRPGAPLSNLLVNDFWGTPLSHSGSHKSFRPLTTATFRLNYALSRAHPRSYHLLNVALHALATYLFVLYARTVVPRRLRQGALLSGLMFALHPVHTEAVAGVVGRAEVLSAVFFFAALLSYRRHVSKLLKDRDLWSERVKITSMISICFRDLDNLTDFGV